MLIVFRLDSDAKIPPMEEVTSLSRRLQGGFKSRPDHTRHFAQTESSRMARQALNLYVYRQDLMIKN